MIQTREQEITPERASEMLDKHYTRVAKGEFLQRSVSPSQVARYAADMEQGAWNLCPEPIVIDSEGDLLNGQHRLEAVRKFGKPVKFMVSEGWPAATIDVIDRGRCRTVGQQMQLHGYSNANNYAGCANAVARIANQAAITSSYAGVMFVLEKLNLRSHVDRLLAKIASPRDFQARVVGPLAYYHTVSPRKAENFADDLFNFTAEKGSAVQHYLRWMKSGPKHSDAHMKGICAAIRSWDQGSEASVLRPHIEAVKWLADLNPKMRDNIKQVIPRTASK